MNTSLQPLADLACIRCHTDAVADGWVHTDDGWLCDSCWVPDAITEEPVSVDVAVECAGGSLMYPTWHHPDAVTDCGACRDDMAREEREDYARDARSDR